jgi:hypothetical protein
VEALRQVEEEKERRAQLKGYRDRGEEVPLELRRATSKKDSKEKGSSTGKKKKELRPEVKALLAGLEPGKGRTDHDLAKVDLKGKGKAKEEVDSEQEEDDGMSEKPTKPTFDWTYKKKETEKRNKIRLDAIFYESGGAFAACLQIDSLRTDFSFVGHLRFQLCAVDQFLLRLHLYRVGSTVKRYSSSTSNAAGFTNPIPLL